MALTILEAAKEAANQGLTYKSGVLEMFAAETDLLRVLPFTSIMGSAYAYLVETSLAGTAFRGVNGSYTASTGTVEQRTEALKIVGGEIDVDPAVVRMMGPDVLQSQIQRKVKAISRDIGYEMIEGTIAGAPNNISGLKERVPTTSAMALSVGNGSTAAAMSMNLLDKLRSLVDNPTHWLMSKTQARNIWSYLRGSGTAIYMDVDQFGRPMMVYGGLPILISDRNGDRATLAYGESSSTASCFCLSIADDGYHGIQNGPIDVRDLGEATASIALKTRFDWIMSHVIENVRSVARGYQFTDATAVA